jgi:hypothetical protein
MKLTYAVPAIADQGCVVTRTLGTPTGVSLEPVATFRNIAVDTASANESADGKVTGSQSSKSLNSRSNE